jgi:radical SAM superfamily enzyme YgiQ (UPF0313 family)
MKIAFVMIGDELNCIGGRRVAAVAKKTVEVDVYFITTNNTRSFSFHLNPYKADTFSSFDANIVSETLACYDIVCFSSMTNSIGYVFEIVQSLKERNKKVFTLLGGVQATLHPDKTIDKFDAICIGEGEKPMRQFLEAYKNERDYYETKGLWFNKDGKIISNLPDTLNSSEELNEYQFGYDGFDCQIYDVRYKQFRQFTKYDYLEFNGLAYNAVWSLGCPFFCSYCSNSGFAKIDKEYLKLRFPKPEIIVREIEEALKRHPYISTVTFNDDNMIALPFDVLEEFSRLYKSKINLPFCVIGIHPNTISKEKVELLASHGMIRTRMGIQSGNEKMLKMYDRNTSFEKIDRGTVILADAQRKFSMIPPAYDIICDNPVETEDDIISSLRFYNGLKRPFTFNVYSLRALPGTKLTSYFEENKIALPDGSYNKLRPTLNNVIVYLITCIKIPDRMFEKLMNKVKGYGERQKEYPILLKILLIFSLSKRAINHLKVLDFSAITGRKWLYQFWKIFIRKREFDK